MLRFNFAKRLQASGFDIFQYILCYGSTVLEIAKYSAKGKFQYILCYGSTIIRKFIFDLRNNFNTSYVTVQLTHIVFYNFKLNYFNTSYVTVQRNKAVLDLYNQIISIHLMLRFNLVIFQKAQYKQSDFNTSYVTVQPVARTTVVLTTVFQYILCYGST